METRVAKLAKENIGIGRTGIDEVAIITWFSFKKQ